LTKSLLVLFQEYQLSRPCELPFQRPTSRAVRRYASASSERGGTMDQEEMVDHPNVQALVAQAREALAAGNDKEAARLLTDAAYHTHDPEIERQVRELAAQGLDQAGRFGKGRWEEVIRIADLHAASTKV